MKQQLDSPCPACAGTGLPPAGDLALTSCPHCGGIGRLPALESVCETCHGAGGPLSGDADSDGSFCRECGA